MAGAAPARADDARPPLRPAHAQGALRDERLSDERRLTRWAHPTQLAWIRRAPDARAARLQPMRLDTEDGVPEVYLALQSRRAGGAVWIEIRIPGRPNGRTGWVPRGALGALHRNDTQVRIDRATQRLELSRAGRLVFTAPVGVGKAATPTPAGHFYVRERLRGLDGNNTIYGPWAFGTSAYSVLSDWPGGGIVGIHGTNQPGLVPGRPSHGCIRLRNADVVRLAALVRLGTPVRIT
jgi:hypothetical protein